MSSVDVEIDNLYKAPLQEFVQLRGALAKRLTGADAQRVKALQKPTLVPWAVNQLYWWARPVYDRLTKSGTKLRAVQIAGLEGRSADVRQAAESHRQALAEAVKQATSFAAKAGAQPNPDALTQTLEALSLTGSSGGAPGRLTKPLQPAGFEALAGVALRTPSPADSASRATARTREASGPSAEDRRQARLEAAAERRHAAAIQVAEGNLKKAQAAEVRAREAWERMRDEVEQAERALADVRTRTIHATRS